MILLKSLIILILGILINNLYDYNNYDHLAIKLCREFIMPIINITKREHIKRV